MAGEILANVRKAFASKGDDTTLSRFVKTPERHREGRRPTALAPANATTTRYPGRILAPSAMKQILVSGHSNVKVGRDVRKGKLRGYWIYTLSLTERATCPSSCHHWRSCFGNAMPLAKRVDHTSPDFLPRLEVEIARLLSVRGRRGVLVRLHALGDFYSPAYVAFWGKMLARHPRLSIYGYTAWPQDSEIGIALSHVRMDFGERFTVRWSNGGFTRNCTVSIAAVESCPPDAFICPEQTGRVQCCAVCSLCWATNKNVAFLEH